MIRLAETDEQFRGIVFEDVDGEEVVYAGDVVVSVLSTYTLRPIIEILFREFKQYMSVDDFHSQSLNGVLFEISVR